MTHRLSLLIPALAISLLAACSGGGGSVAGIDRLGISSGTVTGFGSVVVNGVRYEVTGDTRFDVDDAPGTQDDLDVGNQVTVRWAQPEAGSPRSALVVSADSAVRGPIAGIDTATRQLVVLGQTVQVTASTSFDNAISPRDLSGLSVGQPIRVAGLVDAAGIIRATRIDVLLPGETLLVRGIATGVGAQTFLVNALTVNYATAQLPDGPLASGNQVSVRGSTVNGLGQLVASSVEKDGSATGGGNAGDEAEVEGFITRFVSSADFDVAGVRVAASAGTAYDNGTVSDLALNAKVEVEGRLNASGVLLADEVEFRSPGDDEDDDPAGRVAGNVTAVNAALGQLVVAGVAVTVGPATRLEDQSDAGVRPFSLGSLNVGDYVDARGVPGAGATLAATLLERDDASDDGRLRGPAAALVQPDLTVLGVPVRSDGGTEFRDEDDNPLSATQFFLATSPGTVIQARFSQAAQAGGAILATRLEIEENESNVPCPPDPGAVIIEGNVTVTGTCTLNGTTVIGNVLVSDAGSLTAINAGIQGSIQADGADFVAIELSSITGDIQLDGLDGSASSIRSTSVGGSIHLTGTSVAVLVADNPVGGDVQAFDNVGSLEFSDNIIDGNLQCLGNAVTPAGGNNQVSGNKEDQCVGL